MKCVYLDGSAGLSGDMILAALLDLGVSHSLFKKRMESLGLPVVLRIGETERAHLRGLKVDVDLKKKSPERRWADVEKFISRTPFPKSIKDRASAVFKSLFQAEAKVHGRPLGEIHLHEAGADDALVDVLGCCFLLESLKASKLYCSRLNVGSGSVESSHGLLPVPAPATAELLKGFPVYSAHIKAELVTPTGAALVATLAEPVDHFPELVYNRIGYGAGGRNLPHFPNILRAFYGRLETFQPAKSVYEVEATIDDANPQLLAHFLEDALRRGALDAFLAPVVMKKNRLASKLTLLAEADKIDDLIAALFKETTSIGVRFFPVQRRVLERAMVRVRVLGEPVGIKVSSLEGRVVNAQPEFADCVRLAEKKNIPVKDILQRAVAEYRRTKER